MCNLSQPLIFTHGILSTRARDVYVPELKTTGTAIKISKETTNNQ